MSTLSALLRDEAGFVVSAELVLIATLVVIGLIVGLAEVQHSIVAELNDVADAVGAVNQSFVYSGHASKKGKYGYKGMTVGSAFHDVVDTCDNNQCDLACDGPVNEGRKGW
ncbi:MAG: hypothetical protein KDA58_03810 [Planctomycetaceae bacterium]|nr:hypothetical protein [Planctomycetaceae bacterium]